MLGIKKLFSTDTQRTYDNAYESTYIRATCVEKEKGKNKESDGTGYLLLGRGKIGRTRCDSISCLCHGKSYCLFTPVKV